MTAADELGESLSSNMPEVRCGECGREMALRHGTYGKFWACTGYPRCKGRHGAHQATGLPLGTPTDEAGIEARKRAHAAFDPIWKSGDMRRHEAYLWLTRALGATKQVHIGDMSKEDCERVIRLCLDRKFGKQRRR